MIKYIASDLDGTLLHNGAQQLPEEIEYLQYAFFVFDRYQQDTLFCFRRLLWGLKGKDGRTIINNWWWQWGNKIILLDLQFSCKRIQLLGILR